MTLSDSNETEKSMVAMTVRVPRALLPNIRHLMADTNEKFQTLVMRLIQTELENADAAKNLHQSTEAKVSGHTPVPNRDKSATTSKGKAIESQTSSQIEVSEVERKWVNRFLCILRFSPVARRGIKWNIMMVAKGLGLRFDAEGKGHLHRPMSEDDMRRAEQEMRAFEKIIADEEDNRSVRRPPAS